MRVAVENGVCGLLHGRLRIVGLGVDLADIERVREVLAHPRFAERYFTGHGREYARFAKPDRG